MQPFGLTSVSLGAITASLITVRGIKRKSLSPSGALTAWLVGFVSISCGLRGFVLFMFYQFGTMATKYRKEIKILKDGDAGESSVRGPSQVLACSVIAVVCSIVHAIFFGEEKTIDFEQYRNESILACAILAHHATCLADTLASELGILSKSSPFLITSLRKVPPGTNGGVTVLGFFWSAIGGILMAIGVLAMDCCSGIKTKPFEMILFGGISGLLGSILDSVLGATVQATFYDEDKKLIYCNKEDAPKTASHICGLDILSNAQVNLVSVLLTTIIGGYFIAPATI